MISGDRQPLDQWIIDFFSKIVIIAYSSKLIRKNYFSQPKKYNYLVQFFTMLVTKKRMIRSYTHQQSIQDPDKTQRLGVLEAAALMNHGLFKIFRPVLYGGGALTLLFHRKVHEMASNRIIDDLDFYVTDKDDYAKIKNMRTITYENTKNKRLHFYEKMDEDFYIKVTVCLNDKWKQKQIREIQGMRVLTIQEMEKQRMKTNQFDPNICKEFRFGKKIYFVRLEKQKQDETDICLINWIMRMKKPTNI